MIKRWLGVAALGLCSSNAAHAGGVDISLGNETADVVYLTDSASLGYGGADVGLGALYNERDDILLTGQFLVSGSPGPDVPLQYGVGAKAYFSELDTDEDGHALGLGGQVRYLLPLRQPQMSVAAEGYYAPDITSFSDATSVLEFEPRFEVEVLPAARAYVGYRYIEMELENTSDRDISDELVFGVRLQF
jgi:hypothetical protein